jgi:hypothetical protein
VQTLTNVNLEAAARVVQLALTPVFLLSAIGALLSVFASRQSRVADQTEDAAAEPVGAEAREQRLRILRMRSHALDWAVVLSALAGAQTCATVLLLFLGALLGRNAANILFLTFGGAIVLTMGALAAFVVEMLLAARGVRRLVDRSVGP